MAKFKAPIEIDVGDLLLDEKNPRIPRDKQSLSQDGLTLYVAETYFALAVARSIALHQYFPSEPLIAISKPSKSGEKKYIVVEGNRRLAALKLLLNTKLREKLSERQEWDSISIKNVPKKVPVIVVKKRRDVAPIIGYRHISGVQQWDPYAKARYINDQIESGLTFKQVAIEVGETEGQIRMHYRNFRIAEQVEKTGADTEALQDMREEFGVFTRAMQSGGIREFVGAPAQENVKKSKVQVPAKKKKALKEMIEMLFGPNAVIGESRDVTNLGKAIASKEGLKVLRQTQNLSEALVASGGIRDRLLKRLDDAARSLRLAKADIPNYKKDVEVKKLVNEVAEAAAELKDFTK